MLAVLTGGLLITSTSNKSIFPVIESLVVWKQHQGVNGLEGHLYSSVTMTLEPILDFALAEVQTSAISNRGGRGCMDRRKWIT
jgi:hypothetical protein